MLADFYNDNKNLKNPFFGLEAQSLSVKCYVLVFKSELLANPKPFSHPLTWF